MFEAKTQLAGWKMKCTKYKWMLILIRRIRNTSAKKVMKQLGEQQTPFVDEAENV
jgi:hypothetical protein